MRFLIGLGLAAVALAGGAAGQKDDKKEDQKKDEKKIDEKKLLGKWELKGAPAGVKVTVEFAKDGKLTATTEAGGKTASASGTYKLAGNTLTVVTKDETGKDKTNVMTVTNLSDAELVTVDQDKREETLTRVKEKAKDKDR